MGREIFEVFVGIVGHDWGSVVIYFVLFGIRLWAIIG